MELKYYEVVFNYVIKQFESRKYLDVKWTDGFNRLVEFTLGDNSITLRFDDEKVYIKNVEVKKFLGIFERKITCWYNVDYITDYSGWQYKLWKAFSEYNNNYNQICMKNEREKNTIEVEKNIIEFAKQVLYYEGKL